MGLLSADAKVFLDSYRQALPEFRSAAVQAQAFVEEAIRAYAHAIHAVKARAKDVDSMREKLRRKRYEHPERELTDVIGVRVITYFAADVDLVKSALEQNLDVSPTRSRDARRELETDKFGYRSLHLIARLRPADSQKGANGALGRKWFEIQIRSILDHAWAEIEHETVYKAGIDFPDDVQRRYRAVAGALEVIENAFSGLTRERDVLVNDYKRVYGLGREFDRTFDAARLIAFMEVECPDSPSLRTLEQQTVMDPARSAPLVNVLKSAKLHNPRQLQITLRGNRCRRFVEQFAAETGCAPQEVSHRARIILAVIVIKPTLIHAQFPELIGDPALTRIASTDL